MTGDINRERKTAVSDFVAFLYRKGYRRLFALVTGEHSRNMVQGSLKTCLEAFFARYESSGGKETELRLDTFSKYVDPQNNIHCSFTVAYDAVDGFKVRQLSVSDARSGDRRMYRFVSNHQVPGSGAVEGLFPKPRPWHRILKGKFRRP